MIGYALSVWAVAAVGGYLPYVVGTVGRGEKGAAAGSPLLSVLNVLSGGVFVAAGFMHLLPEAEEGLESLSAEWQFELAPFFASLAFILMFLLEELVSQVSSSFNPYSCTPGYDSALHHHQGHRHEFSNPCTPAGKDWNHHHDDDSPTFFGSDAGGESNAIGGDRVPLPPPSVKPHGGHAHAAAAAAAAGHNHNGASGLYGSTGSYGPATGPGSSSRGGRGGVPPPALERVKMADGSLAVLPRPPPGLGLPPPGSRLAAPGNGGGPTLGGGPEPMVVGAAAAPAAAAVGEAEPVGGGASSGAGGGFGGGRGGGGGGGGGGGWGSGMIGGGFGGLEGRSSNGGGGGGRIGGVSVNSSAGAHFSPVGGGGSGQWSAGTTDVHLTGLRDDGKVGNGVTRVGSKGSYRAMTSRSPRATAGGGGAVCWSRDGRRAGDPGRSFGPHAGLGWSDASEGDSSPPPRSGDGPWIGRRLNVSEKLQLLHNSSFSETGAGTHGGGAAAAAAAGGGGAKRSDELRVGCYDELGDEDGLWRHLEHKHGEGGRGLRSDGGTAYPSNVGMILAAVLSFHAVMEGLGLGASSESAAPGIFAAIVVHKGLAAFSLGCIFFSSECSRLQFFLCMGVFSLLTPLGAALGMLVRASSDGSSAGAGVCTALGAGTFLHVAAMEVLPRELLHDSRMKNTKMACLVGGYLSFAALSRYV